MTEIRLVPLDDNLLGLRDRALTPGHPKRLLVWPYDKTAEHYGLFMFDVLVACASVTAQEMPGMDAVMSYHLHSMGVEPSMQAHGFGSQMLEYLVKKLVARGADLIWATARPTAVQFYVHRGFEAGEGVTIEETKAEMTYVLFRP